MKKVRLCLNRYLDENEITRYWLSKHTGIQPNILSKYYKNKVVKYDSNLLGRICNALNCNISDIIECIDIDEIV